MNADKLITNIQTYILNPIILLLFAIALVVFLWGVVEFIANTDSEEKRTTGSKHILWGIVGMAIMFSVFGIVNLIENTIYKGNPPDKPSDILNIP